MRNGLPVFEHLVPSGSASLGRLQTFLEVVPDWRKGVTLGVSSAASLVPLSAFWLLLEYDCLLSLRNPRAGLPDHDKQHLEL